jgi:predicted DNA binding CopG/RHH family protein
MTLAADFLPHPSTLVPRKKTTRVTIELTASSIDFFKQQAKNYDTSYQAMIRNLMDAYVTNQQSHEHPKRFE